MTAPVSSVTQAIAGVAQVIPCTADFRRFAHINTLRHPEVRLFVAESFAAGAHLVFLTARDGILLVRHDAGRWLYEEAVAKLTEASPVLGHAILELSNHNVRQGHAYGAAVWAAGLAFGVDD
jgi:hypothetical protein